MFSKYDNMKLHLVLLLAFVTWTSCSQICYDCQPSAPGACKDPKQNNNSKATCEENSKTATDYFEWYYKFATGSSTQFECFSIYLSGYSTLESGVYRGCIEARSDTCDYLNNALEGKVESCSSCSEDLCNTDDISGGAVKDENPKEVTEGDPSSSDVEVTLDENPEDTLAELPVSEDRGKTEDAPDDGPNVVVEGDDPASSEETVEVVVKDDLPPSDDQGKTQETLDDNPKVAVEDDVRDDPASSKETVEVVVEDVVPPSEDQSKTQEIPDDNPKVVVEDDVRDDPASSEETVEVVVEDIVLLSEDQSKTQEIPDGNPKVVVESDVKDDAASSEETVEVVVEDVVLLSEDQSKTQQIPDGNPKVVVESDVKDDPASSEGPEVTVEVVVEDAAPPSEDQSKIQDTLDEGTSGGDVKEDPPSIEDQSDVKNVLESASNAIVSFGILFIVLISCLHIFISL